VGTALAWKGGEAMVTFKVVIYADSKEGVVAQLREAFGKHYEVVLSSEPTPLGFRPLLLVRSKETGEKVVSLRLESGEDD
jgi:hypothetical protein